MFPVMSVDKTGLESILFGAKKSSGNEQEPQHEEDEDDDLIES